MNKTSMPLDKAYWLDPVQVMTGMCWLMIGFLIGVLVMV